MSNLLLDALDRLAELERRLNLTMVEGVVDQVQASPYRVRVNYGTDDKPQHTGWLPIAPLRAAGATTWWPCEVGEGVTVFSPGGVLERGRVYPGRYTTDNPPPSTDLNVFLIQFGDGGFFEYNRSTGECRHKAITSVYVDAPLSTFAGNMHVLGDMDIDGSQNIDGNQTIAGTGTANDHISSGKSGKGHKHTGDSGGPTSTPN